MNLLGSLIPGVREVRAPLVSGYLWLVFLWLLVASHVPSEHRQPVYEHLVELAHAMGPLGQAVAVSIVAYLIGSLVQSLAERLRIWWVEGVLGEGEAELESPGGQGDEFKGSLDTVLGFADPRDRIWASSFDPGLYSLMLTIQDLADRELSESFRGLQRGVEVAEDRSESPSVTYLVNTASPMIRLRLRNAGGDVSTAEFVIPRMRPADLMEQRPLLETRLLEVAPGTGAQIERLKAEAEFRFAISAPLVCLAILLALDVSVFWAAGLILPVALLGQGRALSRQATRELFDALRARVQTPDMERITPIYERYRGFSAKLADAITRAV